MNQLKFDIYQSKRERKRNGARDEEKKKKREREIERLRDGGRRRMGKQRELRGTKERICRARVIPSTEERSVGGGGR